MDRTKRAGHHDRMPGNEILENAKRRKTGDSYFWWLWSQLADKLARGCAKALLVGNVTGATHLAWRSVAARKRAMVARRRAQAWEVG
jgi:hypothetical protein